MEWNLYIEQDVFVDWPETVDIIDAAIVKAIWQYQDPGLAPNLKRDDKGFVWIDQGYLVEQLPLLGLSKRRMRERLRLLCEEKFLLERRYSCQLGETGIRRRAYYHTSEAFDTLFRWFRDLHNAAANPEEAEAIYRAKPDITEMLEARKWRARLDQSNHEKQPRDEHGHFSTSKQPEGENSNLSNGREQPHTAAANGRTLRPQTAVDPSSRDSITRDSSSIPRAAENRDPRIVDISPSIDFEARRAELHRQAEYLRRLEEEEVAKEGEL